MVTSNEFRRLKSLVENNIANEEEIARFSELTAAASTSKQPPQSSNSQGPVDTDDETSIQMDTESFERGGMIWQSPKGGEGRYPGVCTGLLSSPDRDSIGFMFQGLDKADPFFGTLNCGQLTDPGKSAAWAVKDVLVALGANFQASGRQVTMSNFKGKKCDVEWSYIDNRGRRELRIQKVYPLSGAESLT